MSFVLCCRLNMYTKHVTFHTCGKQEAVGENITVGKKPLLLCGARCDHEDVSHSHMWDGCVKEVVWL